MSFKIIFNRFMHFLIIQIHMFILEINESVLFENDSKKEKKE